ncbi:MAG: hypothetical protein ABSD62_14885 [Candidatus Limnocylindrales bacterium]|jgi:hypothetical protein
MSDLVTALQLVISGNSASAIAALEEVEAATDKLGSASDKLAAQQAAAATAGHKGLLLMAGGVGLVAAALGAAVDIAGKQAAAVIQVEKLTGMNAKYASEFVAQTQAMGVSSDQLGSIIGRSLKNVQNVIDGTTKATSAQGQAFADLNMKMANLKGDSAGQVLDLIRGKIAQMNAGIERTFVIQTIFGRGATANQGLLRYLTASNSQLDEINAKAKEFGLIFTQAQLDQAAKFGAMLRAVGMEFKGLAVQIGTELIPPLTTMLKALAGGLELFQHIANMFGPLKGLFMIFVAAAPGVLLFFVGLMKVVQAYKILNETMTGTNALQAIFKGRVVASTTATEGETVATETQTGALKAQMVTLGLYVIAIAAAIVAIYAIVKAWQAAEQAAQQYKDSVAGFNQTVAQNQPEEAKFGQLKGGQTMAQINASANAAKYTSPGAAGYAGEFYKRSMEFAAQPLSILHWYAQGGSFTVSKPTVIGVGEKGKELVTVTPGGAGTDVGAAAGVAGAAGGKPTVQIVVQNVFGTINRQIAQQWAEPLAQALGEKLYTTTHGAGH